MKTLTALILCFVVWFAIMALSCDMSKSPAPFGMAPGVIWNRANASVPQYFDLPEVRTDAGGTGRPGDLPTVTLTMPCATWNNASEEARQWAIRRLSIYGRNACAYCHCNREMQIYGWGLPYTSCINITGQVIDWGLWNSNPDNLAIRWR